VRCKHELFGGVFIIMGKIENVANSHTDEVWKDLIEFQRDYEISNYGRVRSKKTGRFIKPHTANGHYYITLRYCKIPLTKILGRLVYQTFGSDISGKYITHIDGDKSNNRFDNLQLNEYATKAVEVEIEKRIFQDDKCWALVSNTGYVYSQFGYYAQPCWMDTRMGESFYKGNRVAFMVASLFLGATKKDKIRHKDGNKKNNHVENLEVIK